MTSRLAQRRRAAGYTQKEFAALVGVSDVALSNWERGTTKPRPRHARKVGDLLGVKDAYALLPKVTK